MEKSDIGLIGLAVMGENLALNIESKGYRYRSTTGCTLTRRRRSTAFWPAWAKGGISGPPTRSTNWSNRSKGPARFC